MITAKTYKQLMQVPGRYRDVAGEVKGLMLIVKNKRSASWQLRFERAGKETWMGLGSARLLGLKEARDRARAVRLQILDGVDPLAAKREAKAAALQNTLTFAQAAAAYHQHHEGKWKDQRHVTQFMASLKEYAFPIFGALPVSAIATHHVLKVLEQPVAAFKGKAAGKFWDARRETASRARRRIENILDWAKVRGYRSGENPAAWTGHLKEVLPSGGATRQANHFVALPYTEVATFNSELRGREGVVARALEFTILTAARTGETLGATWDEIDLTTGVWTIPGSRMKGGKEHKVPLALAALELLHALPREEGNQFVFIGSRAGEGLPPLTMNKFLKKMGGKCTVHGFRSTFRDWAAELTNTPNHVIEQALAHTIGTKVERAYFRSDLFEKRRKLMDDWARFCGGTAANVLPLRSA